MTVQWPPEPQGSRYLWNLRGRLVAIDRPLVMGILNITPDSFYGPSRCEGGEEAVRRARLMLEQEADILDIGACSTRPGSEAPSEEEELRRLEGPLGAIREALPEAVISVDTFRSNVARRCIERWNVDIINDASGGSDPEMFATVGSLKAAYVLMHTRGDAANMDTLCSYPRGVVAEVVEELAFRLDKARQAGICDIFVDPGFGFAKTTEQNMTLLAGLDSLKVLGCPILAGISRKRMARESAGCTAADALVPTVALNAAAIVKGASVIRVHDVAEGVQTAKSLSKIWSISE